MADVDNQEVVQNEVVPVTKVKRTRKGGSRSKRGCVTCRLRRVKCDETRPVCTRCTKSHRTCEGFPSIFAPTKPWEMIEDPSLGLMIKPSLNPRVASNDHAMHSFRFFERETVPILAEVFGKELWTVTLPRAAIHDPVIWYAAVALGSAHESHYLMARGPGVEKSKMDWTFQQYNRAIRSFTQGDGQGKRTDTEIAIVASIIFMVFEVSRHDFKKALGHAKSGINMYREYRCISRTRSSPGSSSDLIPYLQLERGLRQIELQLCELTLDDEAPIYLTLMSMFIRSDVPYQSTWTSAPEVTIGFDELRLDISIFWHNLMDKLYFVFDASESSSIICEDAISEDYAHFHNTITAWCHRAAALAQEMWAVLDEEQRAHFHTLERYSGLVRMAVDVFGLPQNTWDWHTHLFEQILDTCRPLIVRYQQLLARDQKSMEANCVFNGNNGFVAIVFHVFWRCRSARIRELALEILRNYPRREFTWDSPMVVDICMHIEGIERGSGQLGGAASRNAVPDEIAQWKRVRTIGIKFDSENQSSELSYLTLRSAVDHTEVVTKKVIRWGEKGVFG